MAARKAKLVGIDKLGIKWYRLSIKRQGGLYYGSAQS